MLNRRLSSLLRRPLTTLAAAALVAIPAQATWSICVLDVRTGEVVVAGATCIPDFYLPQPIACVAVGKGGGASQSFVLHNAKGWMYEGFQMGDTPAEILTFIENNGTNINVRQFGIVGLEGPPVTFTGPGCGDAATGVAGQIGDLRYAIQGNVLSDVSVISGAEQALLAAEGDLGQRVMAAMETAAALGGDGRCSCPSAPPCGNPSGFTYSSYTAFMIVARHGDTDSTTCAVTNNNCSNGDYYALISDVGNPTTPDPVHSLRRKYEIWRTGQEGRADHLKTEVYSTATVLRADGLDQTTVDVALVDVNGAPVTVGGQTLVVTALEDPGLTISPVTDNGDGTHTFTVTGGTSPGPASLRLVVQDGVRDVQLWPDLALAVQQPGELFANQLSVSAQSGGLVQFDVASPSNPGGAYLLLGSASGTSPGTPFGGLTLPLNRDRLLGLTVTQANGPLLPSSQGLLGAAGEATAWFDATPGLLQAYIGGQLDFVVFQAAAPGGDRVTNGVAFDVLP